MVYDKSKIIDGSENDGWSIGLVAAPWPGPWPKLSGDLFVDSPDNGQAGLAWEIDGPAIKRLSGPDENRWGIFQVRFPIPVMSSADLVRNFHAVLPLLQEQHAVDNPQRQPHR